MSGVLARRVNAVPGRTAGQAWSVIVDLLTSPGSSERACLAAAASPAAMLIGEGTTAEWPIVVTADHGPRVRIYTLHDAAALDGAEDEAPLPARPGDAPGFLVRLPCAADDLSDVRAALAGQHHVTAYDPADEQDRGTAGAAVAAAAGPAGRPRLTVDRDAMRRP